MKDHVSRRNLLAGAGLAAGAMLAPGIIAQAQEEQPGQLLRERVQQKRQQLQEGMQQKREEMQQKREEFRERMKYSRSEVQELKPGVNYSTTCLCSITAYIEAKNQGEKGEIHAFLSPNSSDELKVATASVCYQDAGGTSIESKSNSLGLTCSPGTPFTIRVSDSSLQKNVQIFAWALGPSAKPAVVRAEEA